MAKRKKSKTRSPGAPHLAFLSRRARDGSLRVKPVWVRRDGSVSLTPAQFFKGDIAAAYLKAVGARRGAAGKAVLAAPRRTQAAACTRRIRVGDIEYHRSTGINETNCLYPCGW